ncbi:homeobox protein HOX1A isoform X2 [Phalaenopsis equestris]|uniref:homeobox protein HOX1A isoform X2 n=1 Tax=Phalaenopsis equestris TaxID=78828 RepID=UPI0009E6461F|nr:homeobox protein HOX1A isoform X2 [Phalaenopsis equestris]
MASPEKQKGKKTISRSKKRSKPQKQDSSPGCSGSKLLKSGISGSQKDGPEEQTGQSELLLTFIKQSKKANMVNGAAKLSNKSACKRKKALPKLRRSYSLRSLDKGRVLRSKVDAAKCKTSENLANNPENLVTRKKKNRKKKENNPGQNELSRIIKHVRYMLNRMNYEQSLIDAYSGDGWKGQSADKIRPEKELERAKSEILRCKLKIREIFQRLDSLLAEGRLQESLFDSDGIDSEDIFCGKCGSKDVSADNDIILCDGICERGFHQTCLNPPLLSEDIPTGDEGWLCPECDCKVDCIDLLSEFRGIDLSIEDSWERIFPEAAVLANGNGQYDNLNLPSDDSEDDDYDPNAQRVDVDEQVDGLDHEESDSSSSSYDSTSSDENMNQATVELPTDDSEDDEFDPDAPDPDKEVHKSNPSSDESDFTSDSDEFCAELKKTAHAKEASASSQLNVNILIDSDIDEMNDDDKLNDCSEMPSAKLEMDEEESGLRLSNKRSRERLDYKKLYDEDYGNLPSESSEDEEWNGKISPKKLKKTDDKQIEVAKDSSVKTTPKSCKKNSNSSSAKENHGPQEPDSGGCNSSAGLKKSAVGSKKLYEAFQENQYPTKESRDSLAQELGLTFKQVSKWFLNARHNSRVSAKKSSNVGMTTFEVPIRRDTLSNSSKPNEGVTTKSTILATSPNATRLKKLDEAFQENQYPSREKREELAQELGITIQKVTRWFEHARRRSRASIKKSHNPATWSPDKPEASCSTPNSQKLNILEEDKTTEPTTPNKAIVLTTTSTSYAKPNDNGVSARNEFNTTPKSSLSPQKLYSPIANGAASSEKGTNSVNDRRKAIAKELRRMRKAR